MGLLEKFFGMPSRHKFARQVIEAIQEAGESRPIEYDREAFRLRSEGLDGPVMNLANLYDEYCSVPREIRAQVVRNTVRNWFVDRRQMPTDFTDVHPDLLPVARARSYYEFTRLQLELDGTPMPDCPYLALAEHLAVGLVYDMPESMRLIRDEDLRQWNVTFYEAMEAARQNLEQMTDLVFVSPASGVYMSATGDNYDASRIVLVDLVRKFEVRGELVAMAPNRDTLLVAGTDDEEALRVMAALAEKAIEQPRRITGVAFELVADEWQPWLPEPASPLHQPLRRLQLKTIGRDYAEQHDLLTALHQKLGDDTAIASFSATQDRATGAVESFCVWSEGVKTLLPRTDRVVLFRPRSGREGEVVADVSWEEVEQTVGDLLAPLDMYPPRYRVSEFPSERQLEALRRAGN